MKKLDSDQIESMIDYLVRAKTKLHDCRYVCWSLFEVEFGYNVEKCSTYWKDEIKNRGSFEVNYLFEWIEKQLGKGNRTLENWQYENGRIENWGSERITVRKQWIDWMINELEDELTMNEMRKDMK